MDRFSDAQLEIVRFCAIECELQGSGERGVSWMVRAWEYAMGRCHELPTEEDILTLGMLVEPGKNTRGYRQVAVRVGWDVKPDWSLVPRQMTSLVSDGMTVLTAAEFFRAYEEVHPFVDGNGRTGQILFNWIDETLGEPRWAPNFWGDPRRSPGDGGQEET